MFGLLRTLLISLMLLGSVISSYGETPAPPEPSTPPQKSSPERAQNADKDIRGSKESPLSIELLNTGKSKDETQREAKHVEDKAFREKVLNLFTGILAVATGALAIITGFLVRYTKRLWGATGNLVTSAKDVAEKELRAYMGVAKNHILRGQGAYSSDAWELVIQNFGKTMAKNTQIWINATVTDEIAPDFKWENRILKTVVMPGEFMGFYQDIQMPITDDTTRRAYLWGKIKYDDVFGKPHCTTFRFMSDKMAYIVGQTTPGWMTKHCDQGNDAN